MIQLNQVNKTYPNDTHALKNINLSVDTGEIFGIIGPSGAGKSTLIRCVNLLEQPTSGNVMVNGQDLTRQTAKQLRLARRQIGMIFQHFNLLNSRTVYENIALPMQLNGAGKQKIEQTIAPLLELTGLRDKKNAYPSQLSGGQKQRVAIARALVNQPKVLLCDEATSALDPQTTQSILALLKDINQRFNLTILLITHEMEVVKSICDQVALLEQGEIIEQNDIVKFITQPVTPAAKHCVKSFLKHDLPPALQQKITTQPKVTSHPVVRILFRGQAASEPLMAHVIQDLKLEVNILQAHLEYIKSECLGIMVVTIMAEQEQAQHGINFLLSKDLEVEVLGYVD